MECTGSRPKSGKITCGLWFESESLMLPQKVTIDSNNVYAIVGQLSDYQAVSTRSGGDVISADSY
jgi:hypothetical protein